MTTITATVYPPYKTANTSRVLSFPLSRPLYLSLSLRYRQRAPPQTKPVDVAKSMKVFLSSFAQVPTVKLEAPNERISAEQQCRNEANRNEYNIKIERNTQTCIRAKKKLEAKKNNFYQHREHKTAMKNIVCKRQSYVDVYSYCIGCLLLAVLQFNINTLVSRRKPGPSIE